MGGQIVIDAGSWATWINALVALVAVVIAVISNIRSARKSEIQALHDRISALRDDHNDHGHRLARTEAMIEHLPTREMVAQLATTLAELRGEVRVGNAYYEGLRDRMDGIGTAVDQLVENELRGQRP